MRIGHGYDVHKLVTGRKLILGGVTIPYETGLLGHSDADWPMRFRTHCWGLRRWVTLVDFSLTMTPNIKMRTA